MFISAEERAKWPPKPGLEARTLHSPPRVDICLKQPKPLNGSICAQGIVPAMRMRPRARSG